METFYSPKSLKCPLRSHKWAVWIYAKIAYILYGEQTAYLIYHMGAETMEILCDFISPQEPEEQNINVILNDLAAHFEAKTNCIDEICQYWNWRQIDNEKVADFVLKLQSTGKKCKC
ncbi:hypothetical protein RF11_15330 [Thelohanellus kitauei]|uniref:Uncharacterized protein n=1 Tax=Thelohanellus kitauei TaxID=669202 RepID=A0A0C2I580_THEKT|nr:hypothetical protein RF11_15330 [Thelohanellus kitauei]